MLFEKASATFWLKRNCVPAGLQGALLSHFLEGPVPLSEVVIGRKFAEPRCALALGVEFSPEEDARCRVVETTVRLEHSKGNDAGEPSHEIGRGTHGDWRRLAEALGPRTQGGGRAEAYGAIKAQANAAGGWHGELRQSWMRRRGLS